MFNAGELIPPPGGGTYYGLPFSSRNGLFHYPGYDFLPEGIPTYLGVLWDFNYVGGGGGYAGTSQYGWIKVLRTGSEVEALAWGYETDEGVPIPAGAGCACEADADCDDEDICTDDLCDLATGECSNEPINCDDDDACTVDSCDPESGACVSEPLACGPDQTCVEGVCICDANTCPADFDGDGDVDAADLAALLGHWGKCEE